MVLKKCKGFPRYYRSLTMFTLLGFTILIGALVSLGYASKAQGHSASANYGPGYYGGSYADSSEVCCATYLMTLDPNDRGVIDIPGPGGSSCGAITVCSDDCEVGIRKVQCMDNCVQCTAIESDCASPGEWLTIAETGADCSFHWQPSPRVALCGIEQRFLRGVTKCALQITCAC